MPQCLSAVATTIWFKPTHRKDTDLLPAEFLGRAYSGPGDDAVSVFVEVGSDDDDIRARKICGDVRLWSDDIEVDFSATQCMS